MGYMRHHAIIVTGSHGNFIYKARTQACRMFGWVSPICEEQINGVQSFFIPPDGSKEGWADSDAGDASRTAFIKWLDELRYEDGSSPLDWVEVQYGDDNHETCIVNHSDESERRAAKATAPEGAI